MAAEDQVCKVCYNDLDVTDRSFQACECGFQVSPPRLRLAPAPSLAWKMRRRRLRPPLRCRFACFAGTS